jgi:hypothetical protein
VNSHVDVLRSGSPFVANLHGVLENAESWILTSDEFERLVNLQGYRTLLDTCFASRTVLFLGISAEDQGATGHLERLRKAGLNLGSHFWLTERNDRETIDWAEGMGIRQILYQSKDGRHQELDEFVADLARYVPVEILAEPVTPSTRRERGIHTPPPEELESMKANDIRLVLNKEAIRILGSNAADRLDQYREFWSRYEEAIYRAWSVSILPGKNVFFNFTLKETLAKGAFGYVYKAEGPEGGEVAIKILHGNVKEEPEMLESFRRGVAAMKILSTRGVTGMVPYVAAWEIPTCTVMELVDGPNLEEAVDSGLVDSWQMILRIAIDLTSILQAAHQLPERVLHRDVRPPNIMLKDFYTDPAEMEVVVLDFDLSWHRDASGMSVDLAKSSSGYLAPEQIDRTRKHLTRNALVDSFGVGYDPILSR